MRRSILACVLGALLLLYGPGEGPAWAGGKGGRSSSFSSGGRSFSSPSGRSYSSGGGGRSFTPSGRSYSSGSGARPFTPSGKSYTSGGGSTPSFTPAPAGRTYSSGGAPRPALPPPGGKTSPVTIPSPSGKSYGSGGSPPSWAPPAPRTYSSPSGKSYRPPAPTTPPRGFDAGAAGALQKEESRARFTKGKAPEPNYTDPKGTVRPIPPEDPRVRQLRDQLDHQQWVNRQLRERQYYHDYYSRPVVVYQDPYSSFFWWWLLDQNLETRSLWVYNHQQMMDQARYQALLAHDAQLGERVRQLEAQNAGRNPAYVPPGLPPDLMYTDNYVNAAYNPQPPPAPPPPVFAPHPVPVMHYWHGVRALLWAFVVLAVLALLIWLVFFKRWGATSRA
jgi:hypothetical protein